jgi:hypothetical protein
MGGVMNSYLKFRPAIVAIICLELSFPSSAFAKPASVPDLQGAEGDMEARCASKAIAILVQQTREPDADRKTLEAKADRLAIFQAEISQKLLNQYGVTPEQFNPIYAKAQDEALAEYAADKAATVASNEQLCEPLMSNREATRVPASPERCFAAQVSDARQSMVGGLQLGGTRDQLISSAMPNMLNLLVSTQWRKWAKAELLKSGKNAGQIDKLLKVEQAKYDKEVKTASKAGYRVAVDHRNCKARFQEFMRSNKSQPTPGVPASNTN